MSKNNDKTFRKMFELGLDMINLVDAEGKISYASPATPDVLGYSLDEMLGMDLFDLVFPDDILHAQTLLQDVLTHPGKKFHVDMRLKHKDGRWRWMGIGVTNLLDDPDVGAIVTQGRDITERVAIQDALRKNEALLLATQERTQVGGWEYYPTTETGVWSPQMFEILSVDPADGMLDMAEFYQLIHPDDVTMVQQNQQKVMETGELDVTEYRTNPARGPVKIVRATTELVHKPSGEGWYIAGTLQDVTVQREAERVLREYAAELEQRVRRRTDELQRTVNLMAGRELRIAELKEAIKLLREQLQLAGLTPVADDPLLGDD